MKKRLFFFFALSAFCFKTLTSQSVPQGINYQTVVRNTETGTAFADTPVTLFFQISDNGTTVYAEKQVATTNSLGLINLIIGQGDIQTGNFQTIDWGSGPKTLSVSIESSPNNMELLGTMELVSVPYALYAAESAKAPPAGPAAGDLAGTYPAPVIREGAVTADKIADGAVSGQKIAQMNASFGQILQWNGVWMPVSLPVDADSDPANELQNWSTLPGIPAGFADGTDNVNDADSDPTNELQNWSNLPGIPAGFADGVDNVNDADSDPTNELQNWSNLPGIPAGFADGVDNVNDADSDPANELQNWSNLPGIPAGFADNLDNVEDADADLSNEGSLAVLSGSSSTSVITSNTSGSSSIIIEAGNGLGISETGSKITLVNLGDNLANDDVLTTTLHDGDVSGVYNNLQIKANAVGSDEIGNGAVGNTELADGAVTAVKLNNMGAVDGKVLKFSGGAWAPADDLTGAGGPAYTAGAGINIAANQISATDNSVSNEGSLSVGAGNANSSVISSNTSGSASVTLIAGAGLGISETGSSITLTNTATGGSGLQPCGLAMPERVGINTAACPDTDTRLHILDAEVSDKKGIKLELINGLSSTGLNISVEKGSNSNDGVLLYSKAGGNSSGNGMRIATDPGDSGNNTNGIIVVAGAQSVDDAVVEPGGFKRNYGIYAVAINRPANDGSSVGAERDIAVYGRADSLSKDWAGYFDGNVGVTQKMGIGTANPEKEMHVIHGRLPPNNFNTNNEFGLKLENEGPNHRSWTLYTSNDGGNLHFYLDNVLKSTLNASTGNLGPTSDERLKRNISTLEPVLAKVSKLLPKRYIYKDDRAGKNVIGLLAQEVESVFPEFIEKVGEGDEKLYTLDYASLSVIAIKAIQEQQQIIETQQAKIITQEARLDALEKEMAEMKAMWKANMVAKSGKE